MLASSFFTGSIDLQSEAKVLEDYEIGQRLGEGAYGSVYAVKYIPSGASFALKIIRKHELFASDSTLGQLAMNHKQGCGGDRAHSPVVDYVERHIVQEATVMQLMEHPHVVKFYKFLNSVEAYYFIMELAEGGELFDLIISKHHFPEDECRQYFQQLLSAIDYCHQNGVVHKDLKAENLLLRRDNHLAVCDFGFSSRVPRETMDDPEITKGTADNSALLQTLHHGAMIGTLHYMSPEAVLSSTLGVDDSAFEGSAVSSRLCSSFAGREDATCSDLLHHSPIAAPSSSDPVFPHSSPLNPAHDHHHVEGKGSHEETLLAHSGGSAYQTVASASTTSEEGGIGGIHHGGPAAAASLLAAVAPKKGTSTISAASLKNAPNNNSTTSTLSSMVKSFLDSTASAVGSKKKAAPTSTHGDGAGEDASTAPPSTSGSRVGRPNAGSNTTAEGRMPMAFPLLPLVPHGGEVGGGISSPAAAVTPTTTWSTTKRRPQVIVDSCQQDLWSAGVILFFMLTGRLPFDGRDDEETQHLIQHGTFDFQADEIARISPEARKLVSSMLALEAADRPSIDEILTNKWFQKNLDLATVFPHRKCWPGSPSTTAPPTMGNKAPPSSPASTTTAGAGTWKSSHSPTTPTTSTATSVGGASSKASPSSAGAPAAGSASTFLDFTNTRRVVTAEEEKVLRKAFRCIDRDHLNEITRDQIRDMLIALHHGEAVECDKVDGLMKFFTGGIAGKERITYDEFRNAWVRRGLALNPIACNNAFQLANIVSLKREEVEDHVVRQLRGAFDRVDVNHTGVIQLGRLRQVFEECNIPVQDAEVISLMQYFADNEQLVHALRGTNKQPPSAHSSPVKRSVPEFGAVVMQPKSPESLGLTFDAFLVGILEREVLLRHPMGRKLAAATNLATLFNARNVMECVRHGFLVVGLLRPVRDKLCSVPQRLRLLYTADGGGTTVAKVYSFRYLGESALQAGLTLNGTTTTASQPTTTTPGNHSASPTSPSTTAAPAGSSTWSPQVSASCTARRNTLTGGLVTAGPRVIPTGATPPTTTGSGVGVTSTAKTVVPTSTRKCPPPSASGGVPGKEDPLPPSTLPKRATPASATGAGVVGTVSGSAHRDPGPACVDFSSGSACVVKKPHPRPSCTTAGATTTTTTTTPTTANTPPMVKPPCPSGKSAAGTTTTGSAGAVKQRASGEAHHRSINHRSMGFAANGAVAQLNGVCDVDIILSPASLGYTLIQFRRIHGKTSDFHEALQYISVLLEMERQQATEDTMTRGESELM